MLNRRGHLRLRFIVATTAAAFPVAAPAAVAPVAATPTAELRAINRTTFAIFEHTFLPIRPPRINAQRLVLPCIRIHTKRTVTHSEIAVLPGKFLQPVGDIHMPARGSVVSTQNDVLSGVPIVASPIPAALPVPAPAAIAPVAPAP